ncbi:MAG: 5-fold beta-flower protein, partial [Methylocella sp.]
MSGIHDGFGFYFKVIAVCIGVLLCGSALAQTVRDKHGVAIGKIQPDGRVRDSHGQLLGWFEPDGKVRDSHGQLIGVVAEDGAIRSA